MWNKSILAMTAAVFMASSTHADCVGPDALEARARAHPDAQSYTALGKWFDAQRQYRCAVGSYRSALQHDANAHILERLGFSLYSSGDPEGAVTALRQSIQRDPRVLAPHLELAAALEQLERK